MSKFCELTGVGPQSGNTVSHANNKARTRWLPNLQRKKYEIAELGKSVTLRLSTRAIRSIEKQGGITRAIQIAKTEDLSPRLQKIQNELKA
jgi:large subunit ribosomal protein L28